MFLFSPHLYFILMWVKFYLNYRCVMYSVCTTSLKCFLISVCFCVQVPEKNLWEPHDMRINLSSRSERWDKVHQLFWLNYHCELGMVSLVEQKNKADELSGDSLVWWAEPLTSCCYFCRVWGSNGGGWRRKKAQSQAAATVQTKPSTGGLHAVTWSRLMFFTAPSQSTLYTLLQLEPDNS